jgi:hypothetical protein
VLFGAPPLRSGPDYQLRNKPPVSMGVSLGIRLGEGQVVEILATTNRSTQVRWVSPEGEEVIGWAESRYVRARSAIALTEQAKPILTPGSQPPKKGVLVGISPVLQSGPDGQGEPMIKLEKGEVVEILATTKEWTQVRWVSPEGKEVIGWAQSRWVGDQ